MSIELSREIISPEGEYALKKIDLEKDIVPIIERAKTVLVTDKETHEEAVALGRLLVTAAKQTTESYKPYKRELDRVKKLILKDEQSLTDEIEVVKKRLQSQCLTYTLDQNKKRIQDEVNEDGMPVPYITSTETVKGESIRTSFSAEVFDAKAFVQGVADGKIPIQAIEVNQSFIDSQARNLQHTLNYPGVRVVEKQTAVFRA